MTPIEAVRAAIEGAQEQREAYEAEREKDIKVRAELRAVENQIQTTLDEWSAARRNDTLELRAERLLSGEDIDTSAEKYAPVLERMRSTEAVLRRAAELQGARLHQAHVEYTDAVVRGLRPFIGETINSMREAMRAALDANGRYFDLHAALNGAGLRADRMNAFNIFFLGSSRQNSGDYANWEAHISSFYPEFGVGIKALPPRGIARPKSERFPQPAQPLQ